MHVETSPDRAELSTELDLGQPAWSRQPTYWKTNCQLSWAEEEWKMKVSRTKLKTNWDEQHWTKNKLKVLDRGDKVKHKTTEQAK